jgi:hypothetical protein
MARRESARVRSVPLGNIRTIARRFTAPIFAGVELDDDTVALLQGQPLELIQYVFAHAPVRRTRLLGRPFPTTLRRMRPEWTVPPTDNELCELKWHGASFLAYAQPLNGWIKAKNDFERAFLVGDLEIAKQSLAIARAANGLSMWDLSASFLVEQSLNGLEGNRRLLRAHEKNASIWAKLFLLFLSFRAEPSFTVAEYRELLDGLIPVDPDAPADRNQIARHAWFWLVPQSRDSATSHADTLHRESYHALIDRLWIWTTVAERLVVSSFASLNPDLRALIMSIASTIKSERLQFLSALIAPARPTVGSFDQELFTVLDHYSTGRYGEAQSGALVLLERRPTVLEPYELVAKTALRLDCPLPTPFPADAVASEILTLVSAVVSRTDTTCSAIQQLYRLSYQLDTFALGPQLRAFCAMYENDVRAMRLDARSAGAVSVATPRTYAAICEPKLGLTYLQRLEAIYPDNAAVSLFRATQAALSNGEEPMLPEVLPGTRIAKHRAFILETLGRVDEALDSYSQLDGNPSLCIHERSDVAAGRYRCYTRLSRTAEAARLIVQSAVERPSLVSGSILNELLSQYPEGGDPTLSSDIAWPILFSIAQREGHRARQVEELHDVLDDFLSYWNLQRPSEMFGIADQFSVAEVIYLIREVCVPGVLEESIWFASQSDLEQERVKLCNWLSAADPSRRSEYQTEIADLSRVAAIRELTDKAERARIYVDTDGIAVGASQITYDRASRCVALIHLREQTLRETLDLRGVAFDDLEHTTILIVDEGLRVFASVFSELKTAFVSSSHYGLDANLSQRIRHGTLAGALRATFEDQRLVTHKGSDGQYLHNEHWISRLAPPYETPWAPVDNPAAVAVRIALNTLSSQVDGRIAEVRNEWVQIRSLPQKARGLFDFEYSAEDIATLYRSCSACEDASALFSKMFAALWQRTEHCLAKVRIAVEEALKEQLFASIDQCSGAIEVAVGSEDAASIRTAFTNCKTQLTLALSAISEWFRIDERQRIPDSGIRPLVEAVLGVVRRCSGPGELTPTISVDEDIKVPGDGFRALWDILIILLDNAVKHGGEEVVEAEVSVRQRPDGVVLTVANTLGESVDRNRLQATVSELNAVSSADEELELARIEGGSGYRKLHKILRYELGLHNYSVVVALDGSRFIARITMPVKWVSDERPLS